MKFIVNLYLSKYFYVDGCNINMIDSLSLLFEIFQRFNSIEACKEEMHRCSSEEAWEINYGEEK